MSVAEYKLNWIQLYKVTKTKLKETLTMEFYWQEGRASSNCIYRFHFVQTSEIFRDTPEDIEKDKTKFEWEDMIFDI